MKYAEETFDQVRGDIEPLTVAHWNEIAAHTEDYPLDIDWQKYKVLEAMGMLHIVTARTDGGVLVGYCITFVTNHLHYKSTMFGINDILYIAPEYRQGWTGVKLVSFALNKMRERGCFSYTFHVKPDFRAGCKMEDLGSLLKFFKATLLETVYEVRLWDSQARHS